MPFEPKADRAFTDSNFIWSDHNELLIYINQLRYELAMAKAYWWKYAYTNCDTYEFWMRGYRNKATKKDYKTYRDQWLRIAEACEARAERIKEQM